MNALIRFCLALVTLLIGFHAQAGVSIAHWQTRNGAKVYFVESRALPILDVQVTFMAGSMFDPPAQSGLAALTRGILDLGAGARDENAIADQLADVGALLDGSADTDRASVHLRTLSAENKRTPALGVLRDVLHAPLFDAGIFAREQARTSAELKEAMTRPDSIAGKAFWATMYPEHPYGRQATPESVNRLTRDDVTRFYRQHYRAQAATLVLVGDISRAEAEQMAEDIAAGLPEGPAPTLPALPALPQKQHVKIDHPASQAHVYLGLPALERGHPDFFPLVVGNYTLGGGGFVSRLMKEIRDKRGYAYSVYSYIAPMKQAGPFQIGLQTKRSQATDAVQLAQSLLDDFLQNGPSAEELAAAKANLTGSFPLRLDSNKKILENVSVIAFYGLPLNYLDQYQANIQAVTVDDIKAAFSRRILREHLITVTVAGD